MKTSAIDEVRTSTSTCTKALKTLVIQSALTARRVQNERYLKWHPVARSRAMDFLAIPERKSVALVRIHSTLSTRMIGMSVLYTIVLAWENQRVKYS